MRPLYFLRRAISNVRQAPFVNVVAAATIGLSLFVGTAFALGLTGAQSLLASWGAQARLTLYLPQTATDDEARAVVARVVYETGPSAKVDYVTRAEALGRLKAELGELSGALDGLPENPLPPTIEVRLVGRQTAAGVRALADRLGRLQGVVEVDYGREWLDRLEALLGAIRWVVLGVGALVAAATILLVSNTIKLTVYARRDEIEIMKLCGATDAFVRAPFLIEGAVQGLAGALLALGGLWLSHRLLAPRVAKALAFAAGAVLPTLRPSEALALAGCGAALGLVGSALAVGRFLRT